MGAGAGGAGVVGAGAVGAGAGGAGVGGAGVGGAGVGGAGVGGAGGAGCAGAGAGVLLDAASLGAALAFALLRCSMRFWFFLRLCCTSASRTASGSVPACVATAFACRLRLSLRRAVLSLGMVHPLVVAAEPQPPYVQLVELRVLVGAATDGCMRREECLSTAVRRMV